MGKALESKRSAPNWYRAIDLARCATESQKRIRTGTTKLLKLTADLEGIKAQC
jgi:hypothetical protein